MSFHPAIRKTVPFLFLAGLFIAAACSSRKAGGSAPQKAVNVVVLLDLSDRLLQPAQMARDTALLHALYRDFEAIVRRHTYIQSHDRLQVLVAPQKSLPPAEMEPFENRLRIDMPEMPVKQRAAFFKKYEPVFGEQVKALYTRAGGHPSATAFSGSDIWKFFDQYARNYLVRDTAVENKLVVITDGYFDFESLKDKKEQGCRYSYSEMLMRTARTGKVDAARLFDSCGLIPVNLQMPNVSVLVMEISPKNMAANETELLEQLWQSWLKKMQIGSTRVIRKSALSEVKQKLAQFMAAQ